MIDGSNILLTYTTANDYRSLYRRDALNAVAYPAGWTITLSYRLQWIDAGVLDDLINERLAGSELLVVVGGPYPGHGGTPKYFVPLRHCKVLKSQADSELAFLHVETGRRPQPQLVTDFVPHAQQKGWPFPGAGGGDQKKYLFRIPWERSASDLPEEVGFDDHIRAVRACVEPHDCRYFKVNRFFHIKPSKPSFAAAHRDVPSLALHNPTGAELTLLVLKAGRVYYLEFYVPEGSFEGVPSPLELTIRGEHVDIAEPVVKQQGSGALISYLLAVKRQYASELATLAIRMTPLKEPGRLRPGPEAQVLLRIEPPRYFWLLIVSLFLLGNLGLNMTKDVFGPHFARAEAAVLLAKLAGGGLVSLAAWLAFRTVPLKI